MAVKQKQLKATPTVKHDFPVKVEAPPLKASGNEAVLEELTVTQEGVQLEKDP